MVSDVAAIPASRVLQTDATRSGWIVFGLLTVGYISYFAQLTSFPYQDFPNHLTRAAVLADLIFHHGALFGQLFTFDFMPVPYVLGDLMLAGLVELLGPNLAGSVWISLVLISLPAALLFYTHVNGIRGHSRLFILFLSLYLTTDWFFLLGFTQFRLGLALMFVTLGCADLLRQSGSRKALIGFCVALLVAYFTHIASLVFLVPVLCVSAAVRLFYRRTTWRREIQIAVPVVALLLWHFGFSERMYHGGNVLPVETYNWGKLPYRVLELQFELLRFGQPLGKLLMLFMAIAVCWGLWRDLRWRPLIQPRTVEMLTLALTFLAVYFVLPNSYSDAAYVAPRALALVALFIVMARISLGATLAVPLAALIALLNLVYLDQHLTRQDAFGKSYRQIADQIPRGAWVLPVYAGGREATVATRLHLGSFATMDREALTPYLFSGDIGHPMKYFRYRQRPYAPREQWYAGAVPDMVAWRPIACRYQFILIGKPYDPRQISLPTAVRAENDSAALLEITRPYKHPQVASPASSQPCS